MEHHFHTRLNKTWGDGPPMSKASTILSRNSYGSRRVQRQTDPRCRMRQWKPFRETCNVRCHSCGSRLFHERFSRGKHRKLPNVHFIRSILRTPPFDAETFDIIISMGSHHTPATYKTFCAVARLAKPGGRFYLWLYRRPEISVNDI